MSRRLGGVPRRPCVIGLLACALALLLAPAAADILSPYVVPSRGESIILTTTTSISFGSVLPPRIMRLCSALWVAFG